jgi:hypothetical protein
VHVTSANVEVGTREIFVPPGQLAVIKAAEEQWRVRQVLQRLGPAVQVGLEELERDAVACHRVLGQLEGVLAHQVEELAGAGQMGALGLDDAVLDRVGGSGFVGRVALVGCPGCGRWPGVGGHGLTP